MRKVSIAAILALALVSACGDDDDTSDYDGSASNPETTENDDDGVDAQTVKPIEMLGGTCREFDVCDGTGEPPELSDCAQCVGYLEDCQKDCAQKTDEACEETFCTYIFMFCCRGD